MGEEEERGGEGGEGSDGVREDCEKDRWGDCKCSNLG